MLSAGPQSDSGERFSFRKALNAALAWATETPSTLSVAGGHEALEPKEAPTSAESDEAPHRPVMLERSLEALALTPDRWVIDATFGAGGHTRGMLARGARVLAFDQDPRAHEHVVALRRDLAQAGVADPNERFRFANANFRELSSRAQAAEVDPVHGVLFDLGVSSMQLDEGERGFAFRHDGPLDMRMSDQGPSAAELVAESTFEELAAILYRYGEERHSRRIARAIVEARAVTPITTTGALADVIERAYPSGPRRDHPARRSFQALRLVVNDELGALQQGLTEAADTLAEGGRLVVLSYHSLEDRIVKHFMRGRPDLEPLTKRPLEASPQEIVTNPRARAAKLRVAEKRITV
jgi:16S rRNA (cytosine1402-N4)-methyltransferase